MRDGYKLVEVEVVYIKRQKTLVYAGSKEEAISALDWWEDNILNEGDGYESGTRIESARPIESPADLSPGWELSSLPYYDPICGLPDNFTVGDVFGIPTPPKEEPHGFLASLLRDEPDEKKLGITK